MQWKFHWGVVNSGNHGCRRQGPIKRSLILRGDPGRVEVIHHPRNARTFQSCTVTYSSEKTPCWVAVYTVSGPAYAAFCSERVDPPARSMQALRRWHALENLHEDEGIALSTALAGLMAAGTAVVAVQ